MSVNFYLDDPANEAGHIGQYAHHAGYFTAKAPDGVDNLADWEAVLQGHRIFAEHGLEYSIEEVRDLMSSTHRGRRNLPRPRPERGEWVEHGVLFVRHDFC